MADVAGRWVITDEFGQRLGCGVITALVLPVWFLLILLAVEAPLAVTFSALLFLVTAVFAALALRRARRLPRSVTLDADGLLSTQSRSGRVQRPVRDLARVDLGTSLGVWPLRLTFADGTVWRLPRELDDLDGFLATLAEAVPGLPVVDHNPDDGTAPAPDGGEGP